MRPTALFFKSNSMQNVTLYPLTCGSPYIHPRSPSTASFLELVFFVFLFSHEIALSSLVKLFFYSKNLTTSGAVSESVLWDFIFFGHRLSSLPGCYLLGPSLISK